MFLKIGFVDILKKQQVLLPKKEQTAKNMSSITLTTTYLL